MHIAVEVSSGDGGCIAEPTTMFHEAAVNLPDVIVGTPCPDRASPDRRQVEIHYCAMNPNGNHPFAEEFVHSFKLELGAAKDC